ncbi:serine hydrolase domain-containing protein [Phenylobacterium sp.]|uniref:serine hydrolase domain-containing protein n=1 Tax=Phenylobacterium sp. TaxID=1871053 RepID=UPI00286D1188|nr:serine hydrolase domain-containing protein [Phenylobacterium sp.]
MTSAFALLEDGQVVSERAGDLVVPWWSFGKSIIAAVALRLVEQGKLSLDRPLDDFNLSHLLRHQSGLRDYGGVEAYHAAVADREAPWSRAELLERSKAEDLLFRPGEGWAYSNIGYLRIRELIEEACGSGLGDAARDLLFRPMGLEGGRLALLADDLAGVTMGDDAGYDPGWVYHGLFVGPLVEAARVLEGLLGATSPLSAWSLRLMAQRSALPWANRLPWLEAGYGMGVMLPTLRAGWAVLGHTGGGPGSQVAVYRRMSGAVRTAAAFAAVEGQDLVETRVVDLLHTEVGLT